jgi:hypothetical protein
MSRLLGLSLVATAALSIAAIAAPEHERLRGTVTAVSANELTVHTATGDVSNSLGGTKYLTVPTPTSIVSRPTDILAWRPRMLAAS